MLSLSHKGTVSIISSDPSYKEGNARFTTVPFKALCFRRVQRYVCVNYLSPALYSASISSVRYILTRNTAGFVKFIHQYLCTRRTYKGTVVNQTLSSLHDESLKITLTVPTMNTVDIPFVLYGGRRLYQYNKDNFIFKF